MKINRIVIVMILGMIGYAQANQDIVAIVGNVVGKVMIEDANNQVKSVQPFSQLTRGRILTLGDDAKAELMYKKSGLSETWQAGKLEIGLEASIPIEGSPVSTKQVPPVLKRQIGRLPDQLISRDRAGMVRVRSVSGMRLQEIYRVYKRLKQEQAEGEYYAQLYLLNSLYTEKNPEKLNEAIAQIKAEYPNNPSIDQLVARYTDVIQ